jgi:hypothetical protein
MDRFSLSGFWRGLPGGKGEGRLAGDGGLPLLPSSAGGPTVLRVISVPVVCTGKPGTGCRDERGIAPHWEALQGRLTRT